MLEFGAQIHKITILTFSVTKFKCNYVSQDDFKCKVCLGIRRSHETLLRALKFKTEPQDDCKDGILTLSANILFCYLSVEA